MQENSISVCIPTFDRPDLLPRAVKSALAALPEGGEVLVTDDQSVPPAAECLRGVVSTALRITVNSHAKGASANRNHGVSEARGKIIFFLDDDDIMLPGYPDAVLKWMRAGAENAWGFSAIETHDDRGKSPSLFDPAAILQDFDHLPFRKRIAGLGCGFWIFRDVFQDIGGLDESLSVNEDTEFSIRLLASGRMPLISAKPGVDVLEHDGFRLTDSAANQRAKCFQAIIKRHKPYLTENLDAQRHLTRRLLKMLARDRQTREGIVTAFGQGGPATRPGNITYFLAMMVVERMTRARRNR